MANLKASTFASRELAEKYHLSLIDLAAAEARHTDVSQELIYQQKVAEATAGGGELLIAEAKVLNMSIDRLIESVIRQHTERKRRISEIELMRIKAKADIRGASTAAEMHCIASELQHQLTL